MLVAFEVIKNSVTISSPGDGVFAPLETQPFNPQKLQITALRGHALTYVKPTISSGAAPLNPALCSFASAHSSVG